MKATLEFSLPEERVEHLQAVHAGEMASAISEVMNQLRGWTKHGHQFADPEEVMGAVREMLLDVSDVAMGLQ